MQPKPTSPDKNQRRTARAANHALPLRSALLVVVSLVLLISLPL